MNPLRKIYSRIYQTGFRAAMPLLPYREPEIIDSTAKTAQLLKKLHISSVLLVTDSFLRNSGITSALEESLKQNNIKCAVYDGTCPNPTVHNVEEAREVCIKEN